MTMAKTPSVGEAAPDFELEGTDGPFRLSDHLGEVVVLLFYPADNSPVCTRQFCSYRDDAASLDSLDATLVGISGQDLASHREFMARNRLTLPLLADSDHAVARAYDAFGGPMRTTKRAVIVIDEHGIVRHRHDHRLGLDYQSAQELAAAVAGLGERAR